MRIFCEVFVVKMSSRVVKIKELIQILELYPNFKRKQKSLLNAVHFDC